MTPRQIIQTIIDEHNAGRRVALCVVVATRGSTPQSPGAMACVDEGANVHGTLGGGCVEASVRRMAHQQLSANTGSVATFQLDADFGFDDGMICGGEMDVAICPIRPTDNIKPFETAVASLETGDATIPIRVLQSEKNTEYRVPIEATPKLFIAGAGHISRVLANVALPIGFEVHVIDDRSDYANDHRFPPPIHTHVGDIADILKAQRLDGAYVVIVTRGHNHDEAALDAVISSPAAYLGMIGSRRKINVIFDDLRHAGASEDTLARVHAPIGLDIGAVTTDEIAISIAAELVKVRRVAHAKPIEGPFPTAGVTS